ncbi:uncharacterized protein CELE_C46F2.1 [Caenorhabditis elegans]|uniref:Secreted protein n=1 Tax=Caenorhabditis elegans TaxID=6239 RepID=O61736_CAEEL|nr:Secreted protein [Caenorhabditis elegans]CCD65069.2 Secreted protein [Caenorhabditis elegans]|eukprot:NP_509359.2 Uncharacterized protein CELE_C46F2.1 [Caenorhabditis elegans]
MVFCVTVLVASCFVSIHSQVMFEELAMGDRFGAYLFNSGYKESEREFRNLQRSRNRAFREIRAQRRSSPSHWGYGQMLSDNAIFMGELSCQSLTEFGDEINVDDSQFTKELEIRSVTAVDVETKEKYPVVVRGKDFVVYRKKFNEINGLIMFTITISYYGCFPLGRSCYAITEYPGTFKKVVPHINTKKHTTHHKHHSNHSTMHHESQKLTFKSLNLLSLPHKKDCTWTSFLDFWPINKLIYSD